MLAAALTNDTVHLQRLIDEVQFNPNTHDEVKTTPLHAAARAGHMDVVSLLLEKKADPLAQDKWGRTPLHFAILSRHEKLAIQLIKAMEVGPAGKVSLPDRDHQTPLHLAAYRGCESVIQSLLPHLVHINARDKNGRTALHLAVMKKQLGALKILLDFNADVNIRCHDSEGGHSPLHVCAFEGYSRGVQLLIGSKANVDIQDASGQTPLHIATKLGQNTVAVTLVKAGADYTKLDKNGEGPIDLASPSLRVEFFGEGSRRQQIAALRREKELKKQYHLNKQKGDLPSRLTKAKNKVIALSSLTAAGSQAPSDLPQKLSTKPSSPFSEAGDTRTNVVLEVREIAVSQGQDTATQSRGQAKTPSQSKGVAKD